MLRYFENYCIPSHQSQNNACHLSCPMNSHVSRRVPMLGLTVSLALWTDQPGKYDGAVPAPENNNSARPRRADTTTRVSTPCCTSLATATATDMLLWRGSCGARSKARWSHAGSNTQAMNRYAGDGNTCAQHHNFSANMFELRHVPRPGIEPGTFRSSV